MSRYVRRPAEQVRLGDLIVMQGGQAVVDEIRPVSSGGKGRYIEGIRPMDGRRLSQIFYGASYVVVVT
jgi:hypothetical protein